MGRRYRPYLRVWLGLWGRVFLACAILVTASVIGACWWEGVCPYTMS